MLDNRSKKILEFIKDSPNLSSKEIYDNLDLKIAYATFKRNLAKLKSEQLISTLGKGKATKYIISPFYDLLYPIDMEDYFAKEIDERQIKNSFNFSLIRTVLDKATLFKQEELTLLEELQKKYLQNMAELSQLDYKNELERLSIDLSWKSSQIEGNTYSLLETELLLKENKFAVGKKKEEAIMLLNHKYAIDFIIENHSYLSELTVSAIEDIHSLLIKNLGVERNIRKRRVGITGTNYQPLDNEYQIKEALSAMCKLVNSRENVFEKALLLLVLISYIQAFGDGNKRTARIISNAILITNQYCPISFRTINSIDYKKAMLLFYEQNNITAFKKIFIEQFKFAVKTYF